MSSARIALVSLAAVALIAAVTIASCSKSNSYNNPTNPGGGGGGGAVLNSGNVVNGQVYQHIFAAAGSFPYHCAIHGLAMSGTVTVNASSTNDSLVVNMVGGNAYSPASVTIKPGGYVRWINGSGVTHTVTSN